ncbi:MAG: NAD(P)H-dependent oxidoreductase subunit E [Nocardioides sp.]
MTESDRGAVVRAIAEHHQSARGPLLPILHAVMEEFGHIERADQAVIADVLNLSVAEVFGVVSFYHDFRTEPRAAHTVTLCRGEACQAVGASALYAETTARASQLGADAAVEEVFCLGNCALGPSGTVDGRLHGRLTATRIDALTSGWRS